MGSALGSHLGGRPISQAAVRLLGIVRLTAGFDHLRGLGAGWEPFAVEALVAKAAMETFDVTVLPRTAVHDEGGSDLLIAQPARDGDGGDLAAAVRTHERRRAAVRTAVGYLDRLDDLRVEYPTCPEADLEDDGNVVPQTFPVASPVTLLRYNPTYGCYAREADCQTHLGRVCAAERGRPVGMGDGAC